MMVDIDNWLMVDSGLISEGVVGVSSNLKIRGAPGFQNDSIEGYSLGTKCVGSPVLNTITRPVMIVNAG